MSLPGRLVDSFGRTIRDLRISVTDRCNFRCLYCLPESEEAADFYRTQGQVDPKPIKRDWKPRTHFLSYEEIERVVRVAVGQGITKIRLTGGEPLLRRNVPELVAKLAALPIEDLALTTNGFHFAESAEELHAAGLRRVTFSLDTLERENFNKFTGRDRLEEVLAAIRQARDLGFDPVKVNAVVIRHLNDHEIEALAEFAHAEGLSFRFIEFMPLDSGRAWQKEHVVSGAEILERLNVRFNLQPKGRKHPSTTSKCWRFDDGPAEVGLITPVTKSFCDNCNRLRLTADGKIRTCLFSLHEHDLKPLLRDGASDADLAKWLAEVVLKKEERHNIGETDFEQPNRTMSSIGG